MISQDGKLVPEGQVTCSEVKLLKNSIEKIT